MKKGFTTFLSALKANTPPCKKGHPSLRFLSLFLILFFAVGNVWGQETVIIGSYSGAFTLESNHEVAGYSGGTNSSTLTSASDGFGASKGSKLGSTSNIGSKLSSKNHIRFKIDAGEKVRFYYYQTSGTNKETTFATSDYSQSANYYHTPTPYTAAQKNTLYYVDFEFTTAGTYAISVTSGQSVYAAGLLFTPSAPVTTPVTTVTIDGGENAYVGVTKTLSATTDVAATEYKWEVNGVDQGVNAATFDFTPAADGMYNVVCKARNEYNDAGAYISSSVLQITAGKLCGELIRATRNGKNIDPVTGVVGGTATKNTQDNGKLGSAGHYWKLVLASGNFMPGDVVTVNVSTAAGQGTLAITTDQAGTNVVATAAGVGIVGNNALTITEAVGNTIWLSRDGTNNTWNGVVDAIFVTRSCETSTDCEIKSLTINGETITPSAKVYSYEVAAASALTEVAVTYAIHPLATASPASGFTVAVPTAGDPANTQTITVTAEDGTHSDTYTISVSKATAASDVVTLDALGVTGYTLSPAFAAATTAYTITKAYGAEDPGTDKVTYTKSETAQTVNVAYDGTNHKFVVTVTAEDNTTTQDYEITINEAEAPKSLSRVLFSNGFDAFIDNTNHTVKAYYVAGQAAPTATTITAGAGTAGALSEGKIRVTGADDSYVDYIVTLAEVTPNTTAVAEADPAGEFAGDEAWVKNGLLVYGNAAGYSAGDKWYVNRRLLKSSDAADDQRVIAGWVRSYFFVGNAYKFIMTVSNNTAIKYSIDGGEQVANNAATVEITLPAGNHMIEIVSNQSNGDCRLSAPKLVERPATYSVTYKAGEGTGDDVIDAFEYAAGDEVTVQANAFTAPANKKFNGWASAPAVTISEGKFEMPASNVVLTAQWKEYFTITYKDGETILGTEEVFTDATPAGIANPSKIDYDFAGWVDGENSPVTIANLSATTTVYAKWTADPCPDKKSVVKVAMTSTSTATVTGHNANEYAGGYIINNLADGDNAFAYDFGEGSVTGYKLKGSGSAIFATLAKGGFEAGDKVVFAVTQKAGDNKLAVYAAKDKNNVLKLAEIDVADAGIYEYKLKAADIAAIEAAGADYKSIGSYRGDYNPYIYSVELKGCRSWAVFHTLTFKNIDGTETIAAESLEEGAYASTVAPAAPKITMKRFLGWAEAVDGTPVDLTAYTITEDKTLYAVYEDIDCPTKGTVYSLAFDATATAGEGVEYTVNKNNDDVKIPASIAAISGGEAYFGTTANADVTILVKDGETAFRANNSNNYMHLVVECPLQVGDTIAFTSSTTRELNFYKNAPSGTSVTSSSQKIIITNTEHALYGAEVIYIKGGNAACTVKTINIIRPAVYDVTFNMMGHGDQVAAIEDVLEGHKIAAPSPAPTDADYRFGGWYKENTLANEWDFDNDVVTDNITLYAKWVDKSDATLKSLKYGTTEIALEAGVYTYAVNLSPLATDVPALTAVPSNPNATADVTNAAALDGEGHATSTVLVTPEEGGSPQTYTVNFTKLHIYTELADVTETTSWNWNGVATDEVKINDVAVRGLILANYIDAPNFEKLEGQENARAYRSNDYPAYQGTYLRFHATKPGKLTMNVRNSSGSPKLYVNGGDPIATLSGTRKDYNVIVPAGDVIITSTDGEMRIYNMTYKLLEELTPDYTRDVRQGYYGTICLPNGGVMVGAAVYEIAYMDYKDDAPYKIYFDEILNGKMESGVPYVFLPNEGADKLAVFYTDEANESAKSANGLYGFIGTSATDEYQIPGGAGNYIIQNNQYREVLAGADARIVSNRAYIKLSEVPGYNDPLYVAPEPAPGRKRVAMGTTGAQVATGVDQVQGDEVPTKMIINGQLFILRGEKMYDAQGKLVR